MDLKTFEKPATSDSAANRLARHRRCKNGRVFCHACGHRKPTAWRVYLLIRRAIPAGEAPGFGIRELRGRVSVTAVPDVKAKTLMEQTLRKVKRGSLVHTDKFEVCDALTFCGCRPLNVGHGKSFTRGRVHQRSGGPLELCQDASHQIDIQCLGKTGAKSLLITLNSFLRKKLNGGEGGIRTPGALRHSAFRVRRDRPLCHLSVGA